MWDDIYYQIFNDFEFLYFYGYSLSHFEHHNVSPSVVYSDGVRSLQIGMSYEDGRMFALVYESPKQLRCTKDLLENITFTSRRYKHQVEKARSCMEEFLRNQ